MVPEVSTMVVVRLMFSSGGMVITGTTLCMLGMNVSFTNAVMRLED
jgi:TATA-box binding protein (TBP) (component of TFIID and TFIIIB)